MVQLIVILLSVNTRWLYLCLLVDTRQCTTRYIDNIFLIKFINCLFLSTISKYTIVISTLAGWWPIFFVTGLLILSVFLPKCCIWYIMLCTILFMVSTLYCFIYICIPHCITVWSSWWLITTVRLHCTMLHPELVCVVLCIDNVPQPTNWRQVRPTREWQAKMLLSDRSPLNRRPLQWNPIIRTLLDPT